MCGFTGFVGKLENREEVLVNMMNTIIHRGPDSEGRYITRTGAWLLSTTERFTIIKS